MQPRSVFSAVLAFVALTAVGAGYALWRQDDSSAPKSSPVATPISPPMQLAPPAVHVSDAMTNEAAEPASSPEAIAQLIAETNSANDATRAAAISKLANAPKEIALPTLQRLLESGEPMVDRPTALRSLRDLALFHGDDDGRVRGVVREAIYHGDDDAFVEQAQLALEMIEESVMEPMQ